MKWTELYHKANDASSREPNITDVLNDPVVRAVMHADGVDPDELARILGVPIRDRSKMQQSIVGSRPIKHEGRTLAATVGAVLVGLAVLSQSNSASAMDGGGEGVGFHAGGFSGGGFHAGGFDGASGFRAGGVGARPYDTYPHANRYDYGYSEPQVQPRTIAPTRRVTTPTWPKARAAWQLMLGS